MKILFIGLGSIGRRHLRNVATLRPGAQRVVLRRPESIHSLDGLPDFCYVHSLEEAARLRPDMAFISSPAPFHVPAARTLAEMGVSLFVEKPLATSLDGIGELLDLCEARSLTTMIGYNLRYYTGLQELRQAISEGSIGQLLSLQAEVGHWLPDWRPGTNHLDGVSARPDLGGGVLNELSHELDYLRWIAGDVTQVSANVVSTGLLGSPVDDLADVLLTFANGCTAHAHMDMLQRTYRRQCRAIGTDGTLEWRWAGHTVTLLRPGMAPVSLFSAADYDANTMYIDQTEAFLSAAEKAAQTSPSLADGCETLKVILATRESSASGRRIILS